MIHYAGGIQGLDPATGELLWFCRGVTSSQSSPVFGSGLLYTDAGRGGNNCNAVDPTGKGDVSKTHVKWQAKTKTAAGSSAIVVGDHVYRGSEPGMIKCWELATGEMVYEERMPEADAERQPHRMPGRPHLFRQPRQELRHQGRAGNSSCWPPTTWTTAPTTRPRPCPTGASSSRGNRICGASGTRSKRFSRAATVRDAAALPDGRGS